MHGVDGVFLRERDEARDVCVRGCRGEAQGVRGVVVVGVAGVGVGICCEGFETEFAGGGEDAGCDFASGSAVLV